ncbi:MAG: methionyl-tRNA formyltransferase [Fibrobacter sp.]|jgi:methionyl-tRNA formyltransferase|nr:methionyl-tRNA formyltransferase [Fibrobacter sp.]
MRIVFMGSADFGIPALECLLTKYSIVGIVSTPAKPRGRGLKLADSPVTCFARQKGLEPVITPENVKSPELPRILTDLRADIFVVVAFRILPRSIFSIPPLGTVNIHASLLPEFRGPAPIQRAIEAGRTETGVTIFRIEEGVDTGEIILQKKTPIGPEETTPELYNRLSHLGAEALMESLDMLREGKKVTTVPQDHSLASKAPKLLKEEALIQWQLSSDQIFNKIRAFKPFPGTFAMLGGKRLGIEWAKIIDRHSASAKPGSVVSVYRDFFDVQCGNGILRILTVKPEGRKIMSVHDFLLSSNLKEGDILL